MVNARAISDFAWAIENLLNRILDGTLQRSPAVLQTLRAAIAGCRTLIAELESGSSDRTDMTPLAARAHALASGREEVAAAPISPAPTPPDATPASAVYRVEPPKPAPAPIEAAPPVASRRRQPAATGARAATGA
jgi:chemosensory pili system protein ChpA (sensor histidine kinase/response regulator)